MDRLSQLFAQQIALTYGCLDRIVIRGYYPALQRPENVVHFLHDIVGAATVDPGALASRTATYRQWLDDYVQDHHIQRLAAPKGVRKEDFVQPFYQWLGRNEGIACILTGMEEGTTFVSYEPRFKTKDDQYRIIKRCRKRFQHLYFYLYDAVMGPMCLQVGTYLPFAVQAYCNGHSFVAEQLTKQGIAFRKYDNAILAVDDVAALHAAAAALTPAVIRQRCDYWARRLAPRFTQAEREQAHLAGYHYSVAQLEYARDLVFRRQAPLQALFQRLAELGAFLGGADRTMTIFGRRINRRYQGKLMTVLEGTEQGQPVLRSYYQTSYVKLYEKLDQQRRALVLRAEVCANDPHHLAVKRGLECLPTLVEKMAGAARRYLDLHADLLDSTVDTGELARLAQSTWRGQRRIPGLRLQDDRVLRLLNVLLQPAGCITGWTIADLNARVLAHCRLSPEEYRPSQLRYDLWKLRAKGFIDRLGSSRRYCVTDRGVRLGTLLVKLRFRLLGPIASVSVRPSTPPAAIPTR
ncbi:MAG: hypothetical protein KGJ86_10860 [Chloroflexota bacterium]|nr:hypothetical protein [Chloroflexota bacterium]